MCKTSYPRVMLAGGSSGSGKTLITCGILRALIERGLRVSSFKCGPDYIDPMFHSTVLGTRSRNLDTFFTDGPVTRYLFRKNAAGSDISVIEGVMGYYDGLGGISSKASSYEVASVTSTPVILIVNCRGMSLSIVPYIAGFAGFMDDSHIKGVILNQMSAMLYPSVRDIIEERLPGIRVYGYVPKIDSFSLKSRHLGLVMPDEIPELREKLRVLAETFENTIDIDGLLSLSRGAAKMSEGPLPETVKEIAVLSKDWKKGSMGKVARVALARDEAFCFQYEDNLDLIRELGAELVLFSPIHDSHIPDDIDGMLLYGGYPELHANKLSENKSMLDDIKRLIGGGLPVMAECGGFMYLMDEMEDNEGNSYPVVGIIPGNAFRTNSLGRFGYISLTRNEGTASGFLPYMASSVRGHEFHYYDTTNNGDAFRAYKWQRNKSWDCIHLTDTLWAGFPHIYYYSNPVVPAAFVRACIHYRSHLSAQ